jgi:clan AA aspartic protease (TIGR02281 family)
MSTLKCYRHPAEPAASTCSLCLSAICRVCSLYEGAREVCPPCAVKLRRSQGIRRLVMVALVLLLAGGAAAWAYQRSLGTLPSASDAGTTFDYGKYADEVKQQRDHLTAEPCDRSMIVKHGETLIRAGDRRGALGAADAFFARCGGYPRLLWVTYGAHRDLSEFDAAAADATKLIESSPSDKDYWVWRGMVLESKGELDKAASDFRQAIALQPALKSIPLNLVNVLERQKKPCEAMFALEQYLHLYPSLRREPQFGQQLLALSTAGNCEGMAGKGRALLRFEPGGTVIYGNVTVNQRVKGRFVIDTGATYVTISSAFAAKLGLEASSGSTILVQTAGGPQTVRLGVVDQVELQGAKAARVEVAIAENLPEELDGLLGMSFLSRFDMQLNTREGKLELAARAEPGLKK